MHSLDINNVTSNPIGQLHDHSVISSVHILTSALHVNDPNHKITSVNDDVTVPNHNMTSFNNNVMSSVNVALCNHIVRSTEYLTSPAHIKPREPRQSGRLQFHTQSSTVLMTTQSSNHDTKTQSSTSFYSMQSDLSGEQSSPCGDQTKASPSGDQTKSSQSDDQTNSRVPINDLSLSTCEINSSICEEPTIVSAHQPRMSAENARKRSLGEKAP